MFELLTSVLVFTKAFVVNTSKDDTCILKRLLAQHEISQHTLITSEITRTDLDRQERIAMRK